MAVFLFVLVLSCGSATAATINVHPGTNAIQKAITTAKAGDTLNLSAGTYQEHDLNVNKNLIITGPKTTGTPSAIIDAQYQGRAFNINTGTKVTLQYMVIENGNANMDTDTRNGGAIYNRGTLTIKNTKITKNTATYGGAIFTINTCTVTNSNINGNSAPGYAGGGIYSTGTLIVINSNINGNSATYGGGIYNGLGTVSVTNSNINGNNATYGGGIENYATVTMNSSNINGNNAAYGGGIDNENTLTVSGCNFTYNTATTSGNAIYNFYSNTINGIIHFCRFYDPASGYEIYSSKGAIDANYNWWGSNYNPSSKVYGTVYTNPWLVLKVSASPTLIGKNLKSVVTADLTHDSAGVAHTLSNGPNGIPVTFTTSLGSINSTVSTVNGVAKATLTAGSTSGVADVSTLLDNEITSTSVTIDAIPPKVTATTPTNYKTGVSRTGTIIIKFSENIYSSIYYNKITVKNLTTGKTTTITKAINGNTLYIKNTTTRLANNWYQVTIPAAAVKDKAGNILTTAYTFKFKTG